MRYQIKDHYYIGNQNNDQLSEQIDDPELISEEKEVVINNLIKLTNDRKILWKCTHYLPIHFIFEDNPNHLYIRQSFDVETTYNTKKIKLELTEELLLPVGRGDLILGYETELFGLSKGTISLSLNDETFDTRNLRYISQHYSTDNITLLYNSIVPLVVESEAVKAGNKMSIEWGDNFSKKIQNNKVFRLCHFLWKDKRALDFHKCILDIQHRELLYQEYGIE